MLTTQMSEEMPLLVSHMAPVPVAPPSLQTIARTNLKQWLVSTDTTQTYVCAQIGRNQPWLSRYLKGEIDADIDTLAQMAAVFEHSLFALLSVPADPEEALLVKLYRACRPTGRRAALAMLRELSRQF